jgi:hypothetical protein
MKKFLAIAMIAATLTSCGGGETKEEPKTDSSMVAPVETPAPAAMDSMVKPVDSMVKSAIDSATK